MRLSSKMGRSVSSFDASGEDYPLTLRETGPAVTVSYAGHDDWVVRFEKNGEFPALMWAQNMVECFNAKRDIGRRLPVEVDPAVQQ